MTSLTQANGTINLADETIIEGDGQSIRIAEDLFDGRNFDAIDLDLAIMAMHPDDQFLVLTRDSDRMREYLTWNDSCCTRPPHDLAGRIGMAMNLIQGIAPQAPRMVPGWGTGGRGCLPNVWIGCWVGSQETADACQSNLLAVPAARRVLAIEMPAGSLDLSGYLRVAWQCSGCREYFAGPYRKICPQCGRDSYWSGSHRFNPPGGQRGVALDWVIAGAQKGCGPQGPINIGDLRGIRDQCAMAHVPFMFTGWGRWMPTNHVPDSVGGRTFTHETGVWMTLVGEDMGGRVLDGRVWNQIPGSTPPRLAA